MTSALCIGLCDVIVTDSGMAMAYRLPVGNNLLSLKVSHIFSFKDVDSLTYVAHTFFDELLCCISQWRPSVCIVYMHS